MRSGHFDSQFVIPYSLYTPTVYPFYDPTLIQFAAFNAAKTIFTVLASLEDANLCVRNETQLSLANFAVAGGNEDIINYLMENQTTQSEFFIEALQSAAKYHRNQLFMKIFKSLKKHKQKEIVNDEPNISKEKLKEKLKEKILNELNKYGPALDTLFNCCVTEENVELILFLVEHNLIDVNQKGLFDFSPLHVAINYKSSPIIFDLLFSIENIDLNIRDMQGYTLLFVAVENEDLDLIKNLIEKRNKVDFESVDDFGRTALFLATEKNNEEILNLLLKTNKFDLDKTDKFGQTVVHTAVFYNSLKALEILLNTDQTNLQIADLNGRTPHQLACQKNNKQAADIITHYRRDESSDPDSSIEEEEEEEGNNEEEDEEEEEEEEEEEDEEEEDHRENVEIQKRCKTLQMLKQMKTESPSLKNEKLTQPQKDNINNESCVSETSDKENSIEIE
ncbi:hypothetical protein TRFO_29918 [Tritrichomonas foetus]|uniref:Uncharacterized protein n=1 Tax=Tritrichomonas foetus TaxID=1144522 RepID=A0A1J4K013_9EUKA|nr:hypothetical protein TRFO_29918 [Tritrichomonas foetus]|eukprot:OHT02845.1 hypothetical protein TRFO_29918 [Tritrichomonas foetus]